MFALGINYLNGWVMAAADGPKKEVAEWPPHPDRVFMALAAAWFETEEEQVEGDALRWLETQGAPCIFASNCTTRSPLISYVPANDRKVQEVVKERQRGVCSSVTSSEKLASLYYRRPRRFPVAIPENPTVYMVWSSAQLGEHRAGLQSLADKVTHIGHSASFAQMWIADDDEIPEPTWIPIEGIATHIMRMFSPGRLDDLTRRYNKTEVLAYADLKAQADTLRGAAKRRAKQEIEERFGSRVPVSLRPMATSWQGYKKPGLQNNADKPHSIFHPDLIVLAVRDKRIPVTTTLRLTEALRGALMASCPEQPLPEWFSGHMPNGKPSTSPHMALITLPFAGSKHADGRVMGLALALPRGLNQQDAAHCLAVFLHDADTGLPCRHTLFDGRWFECAIELETREHPPHNLDPRTWTRLSRVWASVTPVVLDRHFDGNDKWERATESLKDACERIGLPRPSELILHPTSLVQGIPLSREFPRMTRNRDGGRQRHVHTVIVFDEPVQGPVIIGAGRFRGYGLCRPMDNWE